MAGYLTIENVKACLQAFERKIGLSTNELAVKTQTNPRRVLYDLMKQISDDPPADASITTLKGLNNYTLTRFYEFYLTLKDRRAKEQEQQMLNQQLNEDEGLIFDTLMRLEDDQLKKRHSRPKSKPCTFLRRRPRSKHVPDI